MRKTPANGSTSDIDILTRVLGNNKDQLPPDIARYILTLEFSEQDKGRAHDLAVRNQEDALSPTEKEELFAYARAGNAISLLKSKARRALGAQTKKRAAT